MLTRRWEGVQNPENFADVIFERPLMRVHFDRKLQTTLLPTLRLFASSLWHKNLTESCRASELLETLLVALRQWPTVHYYAKIWRCTVKAAGTKVGGGITAMP